MYAKKTNYRDELFARAIKAGTEIQETNQKLLLRMRLCVSFFPFFLFLLDGCVGADADMLFVSFSVYRQQADLIVKPPKGSGGGGAHSNQQAGGEFYLGD